ncbi:hypothetical protein F5B18DRAFT_645665 [Nemania serpens]|nr:hypothetical protein F5B18DRAFT_645665 [Nemania serpens]
MPATTYEQRAEAAVRAVMLGMSIRGAATKWQISRSYVKRRLDGIPTRKEVNNNFQALSPYLESQLCHWAIGQARLGYAPSLVKFQAMAQRLLTASSDGKKLGKTWYRYFLDRNVTKRSWPDRVRDHPLSNYPKAYTAILLSYMIT